MNKKTDQYKKFSDEKDSLMTHGYDSHSNKEKQFDIQNHDMGASETVVATSTENLATKNTIASDVEKEKLEQEVREAKSKAEENWDLLLRSKAEIENIRRRAALDIEKAHKFSIENFAKELMHVVDSLDKGLEVVITDNTDNNQIEAMQQGMQLTHKLLIDTLAKFGMQEINPLGNVFDPAKHEALLMQETNDVGPNNVLTVVQKGFLIHDRVLRPARVIVAKPFSSS